MLQNFKVSMPAVVLMVVLAQTSQAEPEINVQSVCNWHAGQCSTGTNTCVTGAVNTVERDCELAKASCSLCQTWCTADSGVDGWSEIHEECENKENIAHVLFLMVQRHELCVEQLDTTACDTCGVLAAYAESNGMYPAPAMGLQCSCAEAYVGCSEGSDQSQCEVCVEKCSVVEYLSGSYDYPEGDSAARHEFCEAELA